MKILAIETSCDETAISIVEAKGGLTKPVFSVLTQLVSSQIELHREFGGVVPMLAKREHGKNLVPLLIEALNSTSKNPVKLADGLATGQARKLARQNFTEAKLKWARKLLEREPELKDLFFKHLIDLPKPKIDAIAVTAGPGLEPALWVGINFAQALGLLWDIPVVPTNHLEGHLIAPLLNKKLKIKNKKEDIKIKFPAIGLIISGGHTELVLVKKWRDYQAIGQTRDDAVGEAFDKVARLLDLPYPGGPEISKLAEIGKKRDEIKLPRPMLHSGDFDFSFSGLKTAVLYLIKKLGDLSSEQKASIAKEFEDAAAEVVVAKTMSAAKKYGTKSIIVGGGVIANRAIREAFAKAVKNTDHPVKLADGLATGQEKYNLVLPDQNLTGDNATMIAGAGYLKLTAKALTGPKRTGQAKLPTIGKIKADGNLKLGQ